MDKETIERYINNRCTEKEKAIVQRWIEQEGAQWYERYFDGHYHDQQEPGSDAAADAVFMQVLQIIRYNQQPGNIAAANQGRVVEWRKGRSYKRWWMAAACMALLAGTAWFGLRQSKRKVNDLANEIAWVQVINTDQEIKRIILPDSSQVALNKGSHIRYQQTFEEKERMVELTGEAFFDVTHDIHKPFIVKAGNAAATVYGTAFNVQAYPGEDQVAIALQRGKIGVRYTGQGAPAEERILSPGQLYQYHKGTGNIDVSAIPPEQIGGWMNGGLSFYNTPLKDVITQLERKFGVSFQLNEHVSVDNSFTACFPVVSLEQVLNHLRFTGDLQFRQVGKVIYVE